jgi:hypothetical protein
VRDPRHFPSSDDGLEELGDEVIIAQESGAHAPQRRAQVTTDHPTVVISEPPAGEGRKRPGTLKTRRERTEKTVVIRDRKQLDKMRRAISERHRKPRVEARTVYLLGAAALASLALGTLIAAIVDATAGATTTSSSLEREAAPEPPAPSVRGSAPAIDLDALPDPPAKPRRADSVSQ